MPKRMLIDSSHPEETRVVVLDGQKVEEFDFEAASKRPLKGNIYLAKVTRVEPSLQAAFVEYGGNRQGFLAFSEIHPDYYQIPVADRIALLAEQEADARRRSEDEFESVETATAPAQESAVAEADGPEESGLSFESNGSANTANESDTTDAEEAAEERARDTEGVADEYAPSIDAEHHAIENESGVQDLTASDHQSSETHTEPSPSKAFHAPRPPQRWTRRRHYKIQEVIKRRQIILVQVVKEERGNKGAALTTYLSLAGRYCVLMPNTPRGGGISRKITNATDRKRLKSAAQSLELPEGMGLIIRTAGENRTKLEIKRDYEYLLRMWDTVRELTLKSNAPACVYEEGDLIKRAIRDLYNKDVSEIVVEGEDGYRNAKDFMRMLMPSHAKNVKPYKEPVPLFQRHHIEAQLDAMFQPSVTLRSGGYIVINQTEALVAIDVNSGRATREHSIEDTAYKTNLEAAEEISRQLRLRDLAGLIVIDFIDMEDSRNDRNVEKRLRDCVKNDRARVQIGKISQFGLLEMSRQRLRAGVVAGSTIPCPHCAGQGIVRSVESTALRVLRAVEEEGQKQRAMALCVHAPSDVAIYTLNQKRRELARIEAEYGLTIQFEPKDGVLAGTFEIDRIGQRAPEDRPRALPPPEAAPPVVEAEPEEEVSDEEDVEEHSEERPQAPVAEGQPPGESGGKRKRRRRRRGRGTSSVTQPAQDVIRESVSGPAGDAYVPGESESPEVHAETVVSSNLATVPANEHSHTPNESGEGGVRRKRRRRRRGRRGSQEGTVANGTNGSLNTAESAADHDGLLALDSDEGSSVEVEESVGADVPHAEPNAPSEPVWSLSLDVPKPAPEARVVEPVEHTASFTHQDTVQKHAHDAKPENPPVKERPTTPKEPQQPARKGWWQRPFKLGN
jgi:ribonuclease E